MIIEDTINTLENIKKTVDTLAVTFNENRIKEEINEIDEMAAKSDFWAEEKSKIILKKQANLKRSLNDWNELKRFLEDSEVLVELYKEGSEEIASELESTIRSLKGTVDEFELKLILNKENDEDDAIVTIHSGAGGTEANDWAQMLFRMYTRWVERKKYKYKILDFIPGDKVGIKSVTINVIGLYSYGYLKGESGIHRLVRLSPFDANNKRHTSFASVFVYPDVEDNIDIELNDADLRIETYRASGAGGQHVNTTDSAVRITHLPTNTVVTCQNERSQYQNKEYALKILKARLYDLEIEKRNKEKEKVESGKSGISWGSQIRSYVMQPYKMVKDLRTKKEIGNVESVMDGDIDEFIRTYLHYLVGIKENDIKN